MQKIVKKVVRFSAFLLGSIAIFILVILGIDAQQSSYLNIPEKDPSAKNTYLITHANVIPMTRDTVLENKTVYILDGKIKSISDSLHIDGVTEIDANHQYLTPGLIDMHVHVWDRYELGLYLSSGVTAVRNLWGMPMHLRIKQDINRDKIFAPMFFTSGPKLTGPEFIGDDNLNLTSREEAKAKVISYQARGYDFIKTYYGLTPELHEAVITQATASDMDVVAHTSPKVPYAYHLNSQIKSIEHAEDIVQVGLNYQLDTLKLNEFVRRFKASTNASFTPTLIVYHNIYAMLVNDSILASKELELINPLIRKVDSKAQFERWNTTKQDNPAIVAQVKSQHEFHLKAIRKLHNTGVPIVCGTDSGIGVTTPGTAIHQELKFYRDAGLSNYEVLATATVNAAKVHKKMNALGTIETDKVANLLLLEKNPLENLGALERPTTVFIKGRKLDQETLSTFKEEGQHRKNLIATGIRYVENLLFEN